MKLVLEGHTRYFALEQSLLCYFPRQQEGEAYSCLHKGNRWQTAVTRIHTEGRTARGVARASLDKHPDHILKTSFYRAAKQLTEPPPWGALTGIRPAKKALELADAGKNPAKALQSLYDVTPERAQLAAQCAGFTAALRERLCPEDISLYIGIPFCPSRCSYCSFISADAPKQQKLIEPYTKALAEEIRRAGDCLHELGLRLRTVYWGGGTPTVLSAEALEGLLTVLQESVDMSGLWEHSVEAGRPDTLSQEKLNILCRHGAGRVSVNPQSLRPEVLQAIGRAHTAEDFIRAFQWARAAGFPCINSDIIAGLPGDTPEGFGETLDGILSLRPENVTVHTLAMKKGARDWGAETGTGRRETTEAMLRAAAERLKAAGYAPYYLYRQKFTAGGFENVGWTLPGHVCLYNLLMMEEQGSVLALGAGGVSKLTDLRANRVERFFQCKYPLEYLERRDKIEGNLQSVRDFVLGMRRNSR